MLILICLLFVLTVVFALKRWRVSLLAAVSFLVPSMVFASWTPLISSSSFTGIQTDVQTAASGILAIALVILGVGLLIRVLSR